MAETEYITVGEFDAMTAAINSVSDGYLNGHEGKSPVANAIRRGSWAITMALLEVAKAIRESSGD